MRWSHPINGNKNKMNQELEESNIIIFLLEYLVDCIVLGLNSIRRFISSFKSYTILRTLPILLSVVLIGLIMKINSQLNELKVNGNTIITATTATGGGSISKVNDVVDIMSLVMNELINDCIDTSHYIISTLTSTILLPVTQYYMNYINNNNNDNYNNINMSDNMNDNIINTVITPEAVDEDDTFFIDNRIYNNDKVDYFACCI